MVAPFNAIVSCEFMLEIRIVTHQKVPYVFSVLTNGVIFNFT